MKNTYSIRNLIALLLSKIWLIIILTLLLGFSSFCVSKFLISPRYESFTTMYVKNSTLNSDDHTDVDLNDLYASKSLASTYLTVLKSNAVMKQVGVKLTELYDINDLALLFKVENNEISVTSINDCFSMNAVDKTEVIRITANTKNPEVSADMCNILAEIAPDFLIRVVGAGSVEIIDRAVPKIDPVFPNVTLFSVMGMIIGFGAAVGVILLLEYFDDTIKDTEALSDRYKKAILGEVQLIDVDKTKNKNQNKKISHLQKRSLLTDAGVPFNVVESYKTIRSNIMFSLGTSKKKVIAVSSPNSGEGKSTTAANIAIALAQTGSSVLLIDADMRKPVQHKIFKARNIDGLSTLIISRSTEENAVSKDVVNDLDLLPSGPIPPNPSELLSSDRFKTIVENFAKKYDYVIIDTPPVNVVSDAMVMKDSISGILLVLKYSSTTFEALTNSMKQIELVKANILGFVLNGTDYVRSSRYSHYAYKSSVYGYSRGESDSSGETDIDA